MKLSQEEEEFGLKLRIDQDRIKELSKMDHDDLQDLQQTVINLIECIPKRGSALMKKYYIELHVLPEIELQTLQTDEQKY